MSKCCPKCGHKHDKCTCKPYKPLCPSPLPPVPPPFHGPCTDPNIELHQLRQTVECYTQEVRHLLCGAESMLKQIEARAVSVGGYYDQKEVKVNEGYSSEDGSAYWLTRIKRKDRAGRLIKPELRLAYNDITNSNVKESIFDASECEYADKMWSAMPVNDMGWFGHVRQNGVPLPGNTANDFYTVGFSRKGTMHYFKNSTTSPSELSRNAIENSMGCLGVTAISGQKTDEGWRAGIVTPGEKIGRVLMGQNFETGDTFIIASGAYEEAQGLRTDTATDILLSHGCGTVVELASGSNAAETDKGKLLFAPDGNTIPTLTAYWYISRKRHFTNDYQREIAKLYQKYGRVQWEMRLLQNAVNDLQTDVGDLGDRVDNLEDRVTALETWKDIVDQELSDLSDELARVERESKERDTALQDDISRVEDESKQRDTQLQSNLDIVEQESKDRDELLQNSIEAVADDLADTNAKLEDEIAERKAEIARLEEDIDTLEKGLAKEVADRTAADEDLQSQIDTLKTDLAAVKLKLSTLESTVQSNYDLMIELTSGLRDDVGNLQVLLAELQTQMAALDATVTFIQQSISQIETALNNLKVSTQEVDEWLKRDEVDSEFGTTDLLEALQWIRENSGGEPAPAVQFTGRYPTALLDGTYFATLYDKTVTIAGSWEYTINYTLENDADTNVNNAYGAFTVSETPLATNENFEPVAPLFNSTKITGVSNSFPCLMSGGGNLFSAFVSFVTRWDASANSIIMLVKLQLLANQGTIPAGNYQLLPKLTGAPSGPLNAFVFNYKAV